MISLIISSRSRRLVSRVPTLCQDLAGFDDHGGDPAEHVSGEGTESLHEVGVLCPRTEGEDFFYKGVGWLKAPGNHGAQLCVGKGAQHGDKAAGHPDYQRHRHRARPDVFSNNAVFAM